VREHGAQRAHDGDFKAVEDPGHAQRDDDQPVPPRPGQAVHALRNIRGGAARCRRAHAPPVSRSEDAATS